MRIQFARLNKTFMKTLNALIQDASSIKIQTVNKLELWKPGYALKIVTAQNGQMNTVEAMATV